MVNRALLSILLCIGVIAATRIKIYNYCAQEVFITQLYRGQFVPLCKLDSGFFCYEDYSQTAAETWLLFQNGYKGNIILINLLLKIRRKVDEILHLVSHYLYL